MSPRPSRSRSADRVTMVTTSRVGPLQLFSLRVDRFSQISVRANRYSVPVRLIGRKMQALLHASELVVYGGQTEVARHERLIAKGKSRLDLDHYLEALVRKPGAFPGATALEQARSAGKFTPVHEAWWERKLPTARETAPGP
ncbi:Mu transposase domain-containing protein [Streptomyces paradoxus]|uniref:Mu transposase domain-containing protein n=1 Tax=Streptomyces paradoxus TaxID=66375 RepID=UPI0037D915DE